MPKIALKGTPSPLPVIFFGLIELSKIKGLLEKFVCVLVVYSLITYFLFGKFEILVD